MAFIAVPCRFDTSGRQEERNGRAGGRTEISGRVVMRRNLAWRGRRRNRLAARLCGRSHRVTWPRSSRDETVFESAAGAHCTVIPADLITFAHLSVSSAMNFANPADVNGIGSTPRSASRAFDFGSARAALIGAL